MPAVVLAVGLAACGPAVPRPSASDVARADASGNQTTLAALERGRTLYLSHCGGCHRTYPPGRLRPDAWPAQLDKMAERARLERDERTQVEQYLVTLAAR
jgi:mono/diheme cytochrome c family protein